MRKLLPLLLLSSMLATAQAAEVKPMDVPPEKFSIARIGVLNASETRERFADIWLNFKQQYDFKDGKFVRKDAKSSKRFPLEVRIISKFSDKKWYCLLDGAKPMNVFVETNAPADFEEGKIVNFWAEPSGNETYRDVSYKKFKEVVPAGTNKVEPVPTEDDLRKAFVDAIGKGETFVVDIVELRPCPTCRGTGKIDKPDGSKTSLTTEKIPCPDSNGTGKRPAKVAITLIK